MTVSYFRPGQMHLQDAPNLQCFYPVSVPEGMSRDVTWAGFGLRTHSQYRALPWGLSLSITTLQLLTTKQNFQVKAFAFLPSDFQRCCDKYLFCRTTSINKIIP